MNVDWQAYEDGLLSPEEKAAADELLARDPDARAELEGFRRFKSAVSATAGAEPVPVGRLRSRSFRPQRTRRIVLWAAAAAVLSAVAWATWSGVMNEPMPDYGGPVVCTTSPASPAEARDYLNKHSKLGVKELDPAPLGKITSVTASPSKAEYTVELQGQKANLTVQPKGQLAVEGRRIATADAELYVVAANGRLTVSWVGGNFAFRLEGPEASDLVQLAQHLSRQTRSW